MSSALKKLERIAIQSHNQNLSSEHISCQSIEVLLMTLNISLEDRLQYLREIYPNEYLIVADIGGKTGKTLKPLELFQPMGVFCIDLEPKYDSKQGLALNRLIRADVQNMASIPDDTFHYLVSLASLHNTDPTASVPEIVRILKPNGIADLDWPIGYPGLEELRTHPASKFVTYIQTRAGYRLEVRKPAS
jgi:SAM-dependent methyltransferase